MAKIDVNKIRGYADMSPEDKVKALEALEIDDNAGEIERLKRANDKLSSENADTKRKLNERLSEDEKKKQADAEKLASMEKELEELRRDKTVSEYKAKFIAQGYSEELATETADALFEGNTEKIFVNQSRFLEDYAKKIKADALKGTPAPPAGQGGNGMTLEKLRGLSDEEYAKFSREHPEEYKALYEKGD